MSKPAKEKKDILTLEFAIELSVEQKRQVTDWMAALNHQWNLGLSALEEYDRFYWFDKVSGKPCLVCPIAEGAWIKEESRVAQTCSLIRDPAPFLTSSTLQGKGDCLGIMARKDVIQDRSNNPDNAAALLEVPSKFRTGMLSFLDGSWVAYVKDRKNKGKPRYKSRRECDRCDIIHSSNLQNPLQFFGDTLKGIPKLGNVHVPHASTRWRDRFGAVPTVCTFKIVRRGNKFRVQLSGELHRQYNVKPSNKSVGFDLGFIYAQTSSTGERSPLYTAAEERLESRKGELQVQLDSKLDSRLILWLHHPDTTFDVAAELIRISRKNWELIRQCKTAGDVAQIIGQKRDKRYQTLRHRLPRSKAELQLRNAIANLDRRMAATRKVRDHKFATRIVKKFGHVSIENGLQRTEARARPEAIPNTDRGFDKNGAERQSAVNRQLRSLAPGQKISILESRAKRYGRSFSRIEAPTTSTECPVCGTMNVPGLEMDEAGDRNYVCGCGWKCDRDINAAVNIELRAFAFTPHVILSHWAERARVGSYQFEATHQMTIKPLWRNGSGTFAAKIDPRTKNGKASGDNDAGIRKKRTRFTPASRKSQLNAVPSNGSNVLQ